MGLHLAHIWQELLKHVGDFLRAEVVLCKRTHSGPNPHILLYDRRMNVSGFLRKHEDFELLEKWLPV